MYESEIDAAMAAAVLLEIQYHDEWRVVSALRRGENEKDHGLYVVCEQLVGGRRHKDDPPNDPPIRCFRLDTIQGLQVLHTHHTPGKPSEQQIQLAIARMNEVQTA